MLSVVIRLFYGPGLALRRQSLKLGDEARAVPLIRESDEPQSAMDHLVKHHAALLLGRLRAHDPNDGWPELSRRSEDPNKSDPISWDTVSTTMTGAKEVADGNEQAEADSWQ